MSFLLDTNICSAFIRGQGSLLPRFIQYGGRLHLSTVCLSELYAWAYKRDNPDRILNEITNLCGIVSILPFDERTAKIAGRIRGESLRHGISFNLVDLQIAATALANGLTLVTHNVKDFVNVPSLQVDDWLE